MADLSNLLTARYGPNPPLLPLKSFAENTTLPLLLVHKSVRHFQPKSLPVGTLELLGAAAQSAASSSNLQAWSVVAVQDPKRKAEAAALCGDQDFIRQAPLFLVFCADLARLKSASMREDLPGAALDYTEMFLTAAIDTALAAQNAAVAAENLGLGICYVGSARNHPRELAALLGLPQRVIALFGLAVGWPVESETTTVKPRLPQPGMIHCESYDADASDQATTNYNETMRGFYESQKMNIEGDWSKHSAKRVAGPESLMGRETLREILEERGFGMK